MLTALGLGLLLAGASAAQSPHDDWRTLNTGHFRVHYPAEAEPWVLEAAGRFEAIHAGVVQALGYTPTTVVDVVVMDPYAQANGFAQPSLGTPRMGVFPTAPTAGSGLGHFYDWSIDLVTHEDVHLVHMDRPSRNPVGALATRHLLGFGPITIKTPIWAIEGLATMLEGQLTGAGRPHSASRAAFLRALASEGRLPSYAELNGTDAWRGGAIPYLVGSAFFEWLVQRQGEQSVRDLQARLSARKIRGFAVAFEGVYGASPEELYGRFCAELTHRALAIEDQRPPQTDTLWQSMQRSTGAPAISPDGSRVAVVQDHEKLGRRIQVLAWADDAEAAAAWQEEVERVLARDPEDVAPLPPEAFPHERLDQWWQGGRDPVGPRWSPDGERLIFTAWVRQAEGDLLPELFLWDPAHHDTRRLTHGAGVTDADPHPAGRWAVAVQQRWGTSRLVWIDLDSGALQGLTEPEVATIHDQPRFDPSGQRLAWLRHRGSWEVTLRELDGGAERVIALPEGAEPWHLAWEPGGASLLVSLDIGGFVEVHRLPLDGGPAARLTQTATAALAPAPHPGGEGMLYLVPGSRGLSLHHLPGDAPRPSDEPDDALAPAVPPPAPAAPVLATTPFAEPPHDYGMGRAEFRPILGTALWRGGGIGDLGLRAGDVVGRWEGVAQASFGEGTTPSGGAVAAAWRGWPVQLRGHLFGAALPQHDTMRGGAALEAAVQRFGEASWGRVRAGAWIDHSLDGNSEPGRVAGFAQVVGSHRQWLGPAWIDTAAQIDAQHGSSYGAAWQLGRGEVEGGFGFGPVGLIGGYGQSATTATTPLGELSMGGAHIALLPEAWQTSHIALPALAEGSALGRRHQQWRAALSLDRTLDLFVEHHRLWDAVSGSDAPAGATVLGLTLDGTAPPSPLAKLPGLELSLGAGCLLEHPQDGWYDKPLRQLDHWGGWVGLQWRP